MSKTTLEAVEEAFADVKDDDVIIEAPVEEPAEEKQETPVEEPAVETTETVEETPAEEKPADETVEEEKPEVEPLIAPKQVAKGFATDHWTNTPREAQEEIIRLSSENERNYRRAAEAEYNAKQRNEVLKPVMGYVKQTAEVAHITEDEVIRNSLDIIQKLNDNPDITSRQMIAGGLIRFTDPVAVINEIAKTYKLDIKHEYQDQSMPQEYYDNRSKALYDARQARYVKEEADARQEERDTAINVFLEENQAFAQKLETDTSLNKAFTSVVGGIVSETPYLPYKDILEQAMAVFAQPENPVAKVNIEEKKAKVVSPVASKPVDTPSIKSKVAWTASNVNAESSKAAHNAVRQAMRELGLDD